MSGKSRNRPQPQQVVHQRTTSVEQHVWNYPVPPPQMLEQYKQADPRFADRFLAEWEAQATHRRAMETETLAQRAREIEIKNHDVRAAHRFDLFSLIMSFVLILSLLAATIWFASQGQTLEAIAGFLGALALFYYKKKSDDKK